MNSFQISSFLDRKSARAALAAMGVGGFLLAQAPLAYAHDAVLGGTVSEGEVLGEFPREITLEFSGVPREGFNTFALSDQDSQEILYTSEPMLVGRNLTVKTPDDVTPGNGHYLLGFQITSSDGHVTRGGINFSVDNQSSAADMTNPVTTAPAPATSTAPAGVTSSTESLTGPMKFILAGAGVLVVIAVLIALIAKGRGFKS